MVETTPEQIRTAVIFDRDGTLLEVDAMRKAYESGSENGVIYFDGAVEAVKEIRASHHCAIATDGTTQIPLHGLMECFEGRYYVRHQIASGFANQRIDGRVKYFEWYIDPETGFPRNKISDFTKEEEGPDEIIARLRENVERQNELYNLIENCSDDKEGEFGRGDEMDILKEAYGVLSGQRVTWWEDAAGRRFDNAWTYVNPYVMATGAAGFNKDLGLVRRWIAGPHAEQLRTVMIGDGAEFSTLVSHPETPLIIPRTYDANAWSSTPEVVDLLLKPDGPAPYRIFDDLHESSDPVAGTWNGRTEADWKSEGKTIIPKSGKVELAGRLWTIARARHIIKHVVTGEDTELVTRAMLPILK